MLLFAKKGNQYVGVLQCGAGLDAHLQFELAEKPTAEIKVEVLEPLKVDRSKNLDPSQVIKSAIKGAEQASKDFDGNYFIKSLSYIPNDSQYYDLYRRIVWKVIKHKVRGGKFKELKDKV